MAASNNGLKVDEIWVDKGPGLDRLMFMAGGKVVEIWHEFAHAPDRIGEVHRLRIDQIFTSQNRASARLDDGTPVSVRLNRRDRVATGQIVDITITAAPREEKPWQAVVGARLAGAFMVLLPESEGVQASQALAEDEASTLKANITTALPAGFGLILRRRATGVSSQRLHDELVQLLNSWKAQASDEIDCGRRYDGGDPLTRALFHAPGAEVRSDIMADQFDDLYEAAMLRASAVPACLPSGGQIWIERTHAVTAIDLDSKSGSIEALIDEAPAELAHQIRLRGLSGLLVIDVPRLAPTRAKAFAAALAAAFAEDPRHPEILGRSRGGLLECRVPHGRMPLGDSTADDGMMAALAGLREIARRPKLVQPRLEISPLMAAWLDGPGAAAMAALDREVTLVVSSDVRRANILGDR